MRSVRGQANCAALSDILFARGFQDPILYVGHRCRGAGRPQQSVIPIQEIFPNLLSLGRNCSHRHVCREDQHPGQGAVFVTEGAKVVDGGHSQFVRH